VSVMTRKKSATMPSSDMQWRARKIAMQASRLADQAGPMTRKAAITARRGAGGAADWAGPRVGKARAWMALRAARGSISVHETVAPRVSTLLATAARKLDPPKRQRRRWPRVLAGTAMLAAGGAAATAILLRGRSRGLRAPLSPRSDAMDGAGQSVKVVSPGAESELTDADLSGASRTR
jgi:hypothetical protein